MAGAKQQIDLVLADQPLVDVAARLGVAAVVVDDEGDGAAKESAPGVQLVDPEAAGVGVGQPRTPPIPAALRERDADANGL